MPEFIDILKHGWRTSLAANILMSLIALKDCILMMWIEIVISWNFTIKTYRELREIGSNDFHYLKASLTY